MRSECNVWLLQNDKITVSAIMSLHNSNIKNDQSSQSDICTERIAFLAFQRRELVTVIVL